MGLWTRVTWEKLLLEVRHLQPEDDALLIPALIGTNAVLTPRNDVERCFAQVQFLSFELQQFVKDSGVGERWQKLREFFFQQKNFRIQTSSLKEVQDRDLLLKPILSDKSGHPLPMTLLLLYLAKSIDLPVHLVQARQHFILKCSVSGKCSYMDVMNGGQILTDSEVVRILQNSNMELWDARGLFRHYLEELIRIYEKHSQGQLLHTIYNLFLHLDESNLPILGRRALLRKRMGFLKEALSDLKRYFSFVDRGHAPIELQTAMRDLEKVSGDSPRESSAVLH